MKKDGLIMNERNYARYLLLILHKLEKLEEKLDFKIKNKKVLELNNKVNT